MPIKYPEGEAPEHAHDTAEDADPEYVRRRQLRFRAWHRGTKEADLLLGTFADRYLETLEPDELAQFEALLENNDADLYDWANGRAEVPAAFDTPVMGRLRAHKIADYL